MTPLQLSKYISADFLDHLEKELVSILIQRNMMRRNRLVTSTYYAWLFRIALLACALGLALSLWAMTLSTGQKIYLLVFGLFALLFAFGLVVFWNKNWLLGKFAGFHVRLATWISAKMARRMLKTARRMVPFTAEYELRGRSLVYYRRRDDATTFSWARNLDGLGVKGNGFTLFFKKETTVYPHILVMHDALPAWDACMDELQINTV